MRFLLTTAIAFFAGLVSATQFPLLLKTNLTNDAIINVTSLGELYEIVYHHEFVIALASGRITKYIEQDFFEKAHKFQEDFPGVVLVFYDEEGSGMFGADSPLLNFYVDRKLCGEWRGTINLVTFLYAKLAYEDCGLTSSELGYGHQYKDVFYPPSDELATLEEVEDYIAESRDRRVLLLNANLTSYITHQVYRFKDQSAFIADQELSKKVAHKFSIDIDDQPTWLLIRLPSFVAKYNGIDDPPYEWMYVKLSFTKLTKFVWSDYPGAVTGVFFYRDSGDLEAIQPQMEDLAAKYGVYAPTQDDYLQFRHAHADDTAAIVSQAGLDARKMPVFAMFSNEDVKNVALGAVYNPTMQDIERLVEEHVGTRLPDRN